MAGADNLYERDSYAWTGRNAALLRERRFAEADIANIAQEIEGIGLSQRHALASHLRRLLEHLLKAAYAARPEACQHLNGWRKEIRNHRREIADLLKRAPSLARFLDEEISDGFKAAREDFLAEYAVNPGAVPSHCPFSKEQVLDFQFLPEYELQ